MVSPLFLPGETPSAAKIQQLGNEDTTWTPTLTASTTNPDLGTSPTQHSVLWVNGNHIDLWWTIQFGTASSAGSGTYQIPLPSGYPIASGLFDTTFGTARLLDDSATGRALAFIGIDVAAGHMYLRDANNDALILHNVPWGWDDNDWLLGHASYLTDFGA